MRFWVRRRAPCWWSSIPSAVARQGWPVRRWPWPASTDREATARAREYFAGYRPSSPAIALIKDGQVVKMLERHNIEGRHAHDIAAELTAAFDQYCKQAVAVS
jgi:putative YphP/YqiW family bacilliredoxin